MQCLKARTKVLCRDQCGSESIRTVPTRTASLRLLPNLARHLAESCPTTRQGFTVIIDEDLEKYSVNTSAF